MKLRANTWPNHYNDIVSGKKKTEFRQVESIVLTVKCPRHDFLKPGEERFVMECDECRGVQGVEREFAVKRVEAVNQHLKNFDSFPSRKYLKMLQTTAVDIPDVDWQIGPPFLVIDMGETLKVERPRKVA